MSLPHDPSCLGCDPAFAKELSRTLARLLSDVVTTSDIGLRIRAGIARALREGARSPRAVVRYVMLMFALEPEFTERHRVREHVAANAGPLDAALEVICSSGHPNCWYRVERALVEEQWQALVRRDDAFCHPAFATDGTPALVDTALPAQLSPTYGFQLDVPYVATPEEDVRRMLELAGVGAADTVIDLGSGDGRLVIMAAARFGARGIGIELDPDLVSDARDAAARAGVQDRVTFVQRDLFDAKVSEATVLTMFLLRSVNLVLRDRLLKQLRPGTRVVSRHFDMGEWKPHQHVGTRANSIYCWRVPESGATAASPEESRPAARLPETAPGRAPRA